MFKSGSAEMLPNAQRLIQLVSKMIAKMPQQISISGHTNSKRFITKTGYSNWELPADRVNAARREMVHSEVPFERVSRVIGKAATEPFLPNDPENAQNRRLAIVLLRGTGRDKTDEEAKKAGEKRRKGRKGQKLKKPFRAWATSRSAMKGKVLKYRRSSSRWKRKPKRLSRKKPNPRSLS